MILEAVSIGTNIPVTIITSRDRHGYIVDARQMYFYLAVKDGWTLEATGDFIGLNHATVLSGKRKVENALEVRDTRITAYHRAAVEVLNQMSDETR
jgi:chromosomal replication initiation ATPase DnaA